MRENTCPNCEGNGHGLTGGVNTNSESVNVKCSRCAGLGTLHLRRSIFETLKPIDLKKLQGLLMKLSGETKGDEK